MNKSTEIDISNLNETSSVSDVQQLLEQSMKNFNAQYSEPSRAEKRKIKITSESDKNKKKFDTLVNRIREHENLISQLEDENLLLKAEIQRCEAKIAAYPNTKKRYDQLSTSLSKAHRLQTMSRSNGYE